MLKMTFSGRFLLQMIQFAARQGAAAPDLLAIAGFTQKALMNEKLRIEAPVYNAVVEAALARTADSYFGLHAGEHFNLGAAGLIAQITQTSTTMREAILQLMDFGLPSIEQVAANLHQSVRSLQRRLKAEGYTYQSITEDIRKALALSYLRQPNLSLTDIAALLDYSDSSTFSRSFKRWVGVAPREWREQHK